MTDNRESIRNKIKHIRNLQSTDDIDKNSNIIMDKLFSTQIFKKSDCIGFYYSLKTEVFTSSMIQKALDLRKIVPGIAFDKSGNRLGFGSGYYDKFLTLHASIYKIALAFDFQLINTIDIQEHDVPMDLIITENRTITIE